MSEKLTSIDLMFLATSILRSNNSTKDQIFIAKKLYKELCEEEINVSKTESIKRTQRTQQEVLERIKLEEEKIKKLDSKVSIPSGSVAFSGAFDLNLAEPTSFFSSGSFRYEDDSHQAYPKNWSKRPSVPMPRISRKHRG